MKLLLTICPFLALSSLPCFGDPSFEERLSCLEQKARELDLVKPLPDQKNLFSLSADYLFWRLSSPDLAYAILLQFPSSVEDIGTVQNIPFKATSGFKLSLGYRMPHDAWQTDVTWTWFMSNPQCSTSGDSTAATPSLVYPEYYSSIAPVADTVVNGYWSLFLDLLDGELSRYVPATGLLAFRPHFGLRGLWIKQTYITGVTGGGTVGEFALSTGSITTSLHCSGVGPILGLGTEWEVWDHWNFVTDLGGALIYALFKGSVIGKASYQTISPSYNSSTYQSQHVIATTEFSLALRYDNTCYCDKIAYSLALGWEFNNFANQNPLSHQFASEPSFTAFLSNTSSVATQGLTLSGRLSF